MKVVFSNRAYAAILAETTEKIKTETGGLFLGTVQNDIWYVVEAIDPGPKSIFQVAYFEYDQAYTQHLINKIANLYEKRLDLIGLWHRHPGSFDHFSTTDDGTNTKYASMRSSGAISALVNIDPRFRLTVYHVAQPCHYSTIRYEVGDELFPAELLAYKTPSRFEGMMEHMLYPHSVKASGHEKNCHKTVSLASFMELIMPELSEFICTGVTPEDAVKDESTRERMANDLIGDISFLTDEVGVEVAVAAKDQYVVLYQDSIDKPVRMYFMLSASKDSLVLSYGDKCFLYHDGLLRSALIGARERKAKEERASKAPQGKSRFEQVTKIIRFRKEG